MPPGGSAPPGGGWGAPPGGDDGGYGAPPGRPGAYSPPGWSAPSGAFAPMPANLPPGYIPEGGTASLEGGVIPWEQQGGSFLGKWWATVKLCNGQTRPFFAVAAQNEKADAITFSVLSGAITGAILGLLYIIIFSAVGAGVMLGAPVLGSSKSSTPGATAAIAGMSIGIGLIYAVMAVIMWAVMGAIRPFLAGGLHHVLLLLFGGVGERKTFMHTVRVAAYTEGSSTIWMWIPIAGPFIALYFMTKGFVQGYDETHRCGVGKALLVILAPAFCCCCPIALTGLIR